MYVTIICWLVVVGKHIPYESFSNNSLQKSFGSVLMTALNMCHVVIKHKVSDLLQTVFLRRTAFLVFFFFPSSTKYITYFFFLIVEPSNNKAFIALDIGRASCRKLKTGDMCSLSSSSLESSSCAPISFVLVFSPVDTQIKLSSFTLPITHPLGSSQHSFSLPSSVLNGCWFSLDIHPLLYSHTLTHPQSQRVDSHWSNPMVAVLVCLPVIDSDIGLWYVLGQYHMNNSILWTSRKSFLVHNKDIRKLWLSFCLRILSDLDMIPGISTFWPPGQRVRVWAWSQYMEESRA